MYNAEQGEIEQILIRRHIISSKEDLTTRDVEGETIELVKDDSIIKQINRLTLLGGVLCDTNFKHKQQQLLSKPKMAVNMKARVMELYANGMEINDSIKEFDYGKKNNIKMAVNNNDKFMGTEKQQLLSQKVVKRYDEQAKWRCDEGRRVTGRNYVLPGIDLYHAAPRHIDWQRKNWHGDSSYGFGNSNHVDDCRSDLFDDYNYRYHGEHLKKKHRIKLNSKGKQQGDGIKHPSNPLPPTIIKEKVKKVYEAPKIQWGEEEDFFSSDEEDEWKEPVEKPTYDLKYFLQETIELESRFESLKEEVKRMEVKTGLKRQQKKKRRVRRIEEYDMKYNIAQSDTKPEFELYEFTISLGLSPKITVLTTNADVRVRTDWRNPIWKEGFNAGTHVDRDWWLINEHSHVRYWNDSEEVTWDKAKKEIIDEQVSTSDSFLNRLVPPVVADALNSVSDTANEVREAASTVSGMLGGVKEIMSKASTAAEILLDLRTVHLDLEHFFENPEISSYDKFGRTIFYINYFFRKVGKTFEFTWPSTEGAVAQSLTDSFVNFISYIFNFFGLTENHFRIFQRFNTLDVFYSRISTRFIYIFELIRFIFEFISKSFNTPEILEWYDRVTGGDVKKTMLDAQEALHTPIDEYLILEKRRKLEKLFKRVEELVLLAGVGGWKNAAFLRKQMEQMEQLQIKIIKMEEDAFGRVTPFCVCIGGPPQIGKSQVLTAIADALIPRAIPVSKRIYPRGQTDHYDGYDGHYCIMVDDWAAKVDTDYSELLQWVTCQTTVLPMASLDSRAVGVKGQTCQAKLILLATNSLYPAMSNIMNNSNAILARRHAVIQVIKKDKDFRDDFGHLGFKFKHPEFDRDLEERVFSFPELVDKLKIMQYRHITTEAELLGARKARALNARFNDGEAQIMEYLGEAVNIIKQDAQAHMRNGWYDVVPAFNRGASGSSILTDMLSRGVNVASTASYIAGAFTLAAGAYTGEGRTMLNGVLKVGFGVVIGVVADYMKKNPEQVAFDLEKVLSRTELNLDDRRWLSRMFMKRRELRNAYTRAVKGDMTVDHKKVEQALRNFDMMAEWETMGFVKEIAESDMRNTDGVRRRRRVIAEQAVKDIRDPETLKGMSKKEVEKWKKIKADDCLSDCCSVSDHEVRRGLWSDKAESDMRTKDGVRRKRLHRAEDSRKLKAISSEEETDEDKDEGVMQLPKPFENQVFSPKSLGVRYIDFYIQFLRATGRGHLLDSALVCKWLPKWSLACEKFDNVYDIIDYVNGDSRAEASADLNGDAIAKLAIGNMVKFKKLRKGVPVCVLNAINIRGSLFVLPYHFFLRDGGVQDSDFEIEVTNAYIYDGLSYGTTSKLTIPFDSRQLSVNSVVLDKKDDWCVYNVGRSWQPGKDIFGHFVKEEDLKFLSDFNAQLILKEPMHVIHHTRARPNEITTYTVNGDSSSRYNLVRSWSYTATTKAGDCGAPLLVRDARLQRKILGMHVSAIMDTDRAFATVLTQEKLQTMLDGCAQWCVMPNMELETTMKHIMFDNFEYVGSVEKTKQVMPPTKSTIRESLISDLFEKKKYPSVLDWEDERYEGLEDILEKQQDKYTGLRRDVEGDLMMEIVDDIVCEHAIDPMYPRRVLTEKEMLNGYDTLPRVDPHSSAGYPFGAGWFKNENKLKDLSGKETYLEFKEQEWVFRYPIMREQVENRESQAKSRRRIRSIWTASLKDETLGLNKITTGNTRLFMNPPMDFTLLLRKYTGAFSSFVFKHNLTLGCAAGFNPESGAWSELAFSLMKINRKVGALDYTWFDGSLGAQLIFGALDIINKWYQGTKEEENVRFTLFHEIVFTYILVRRDVYLKNKGNPSGNALTMVMNNLVSKILLRYYWMCLAPINKRDCRYFTLNTSSFVCGDDNIIAMEEEVLEEITGERIIDVAATLGLTATSERKDKRSVFKDLRETTFLKRGFREDGMYIKPTLDLKSIENMMIWVSNSKFMSVLECTQVNVECAMRYLYFWGPIVFNHYRTLLLEASNARDLKLPLYTYDYYDRIFNETGQLESNFAQTRELTHGKSKSVDRCINDQNRRGTTLNTPRMINRKQRSGLGGATDCTAQMGIVKDSQGKSKMEGQNEDMAIGAERKMEHTESLLAPPVVPVELKAGIKESSMEGEVREEMRRGVLFDEQTQAVTLTDGPATYQGTAEERQWDLKNFFLVPVRVASGTWSTTATVGQTLKVFTPTTMHSGFSRWKSVIEQYSYYRYRVRFRIELNGTQFHSGQLAFWFRPITLAPNTQSGMAQIRHVKLNASYNTVAELETYWYPPCEYISSHTLYSVGAAGLSVFNTLAAGTGASTAIGYTIYAQLLDVQLSLPRPLSGSAQGLVNVQNITVTGNAPINTTGDSYDVSVTGMDLASNVEDPKKIIRWGISNPFMVHGSPTVDRLSSYPSGVTTVSENTFNVSWDEMDIDWIKRIPGVITSVPFVTTQTFGTVIASGACAPIRMLAGASNTRDTYPLEWLSSFYCNWRGDLEFCVEIVGTQYHTGKLFFGVNYTPTPVTNFSASGVDPTTYYGKVIEVNNKENCFKIIVPYQHWAAWCDCAPNPGRWNGSSAVNANNTMRMYPEGVNRFTIGEWFLAVLNPLVVPSGVSTSIDINVYLRGGENFELHRPGMNGLWGAATAQGDTIGNQASKVNTHTVSQYIERPRSLRELLKRGSLMCNSFLSPIVDATAGQLGGFGLIFNIDSVITTTNPWYSILRAYNAWMGDMRFKIIVDFSGMSESASGTVFVGFVNRPILSNTNGLVSGLGGMVAEQLMTIAQQNQVIGGVQSTANVTTTANAYGSAGNPNDFGVQQVSCSFETVHCITRNCNTLEIEIPYYSVLKHIVMGVSNVNEFGLGFMHFWQPATGNPVVAGNVGARVTMYAYMGDGFRCGQWIGSPRMNFSRSAVLAGRYGYYGVSGVTTLATKDTDENWDHV